MTLQVPFDEFAPSVRRLLDRQDAYVSHYRGGSLVTSACPTRGVVVAAIVRLPMDGALNALRKEGLEVFEGAWTTGAELTVDTGPAFDAYVGAVAYVSQDDKPGVWVDAYPTAPTEVQVLRAMYEEFRSTGELDDVSFEEFVRLANPNVVIVSPLEVADFTERNASASAN